jgi:hypothetical protein
VLRRGASTSRGTHQVTAARGFDDPEVVRDEVGAELGINRKDLVIEKKRHPLSDAIGDPTRPLYWVTPRGWRAPPGGPIIVVRNEDAATHLAWATTLEALWENAASRHGWLRSLVDLYGARVGGPTAGQGFVDARLIEGLAPRIVARPGFIDTLLGGARETPSGFVYIHGWPRARFNKALEATMPRKHA